MTLAIDVFWSFRSPYSYLATPRLVQLHGEYDLDVRVRPVLPIAVRIPGFFDTVNPLWPPYLMRDTWRIAEYEGIPYGWPVEVWSTSMRRILPSSENRLCALSYASPCQPPSPVEM